MPTTQISGATILRDTLFAIKTFLSGAVSDPITNRPTNESFIMTSYPTRAVTYPLITIKDLNSESTRLGLQSEAVMQNLNVEVRAWANTVSQRDKLADSIFNSMKNNQFGGGSAFTEDYGLHDFKLLSSVNVDDPDGPKSKVQTYKFIFVTT